MSVPSSSCVIRAVRADDGAAISALYNHYVLNSSISFEEEPVSPADMAARIEAAVWPWLVCEQEGEVVGYAYASPWKPRSAYRFSVESSVYVSHRHARQGIGKLLYRALLPQLGERGVHTVIGGIALPNAASVALHRSFGFERVGVFREVGNKFDRWVDVEYWQLLLASE